MRKGYLRKDQRNGWSITNLANMTMTMTMSTEMSKPSRMTMIMRLRTRTILPMRTRMD